MPALLPIILTASHIVLAADRVPEFKIEPTCRAAATAAIAPDRGTDACQRDERNARGKLVQEWGSYPAKQKADCMRLSQLGGQPSYVEMLTCLELAKAVNDLPQGDRMTGQGFSD
jgi:hypothetical protein